MIIRIKPRYMNSSERIAFNRSNFVLIHFAITRNFTLTILEKKQNRKKGTKNVWDDDKFAQNEQKKKDFTW